MGFAIRKGCRLKAAFRRRMVHAKVIKTPRAKARVTFTFCEAQGNSKIFAWGDFFLLVRLGSRLGDLNMVPKFQDLVCID